LSGKFEIDDSFEQFVRRVEPRLHDALSATLGNDRGRDATVEVLAYAWEHWHRVSEMKNPEGYLYVRGRDRGRRGIRRPPVAFMPADDTKTPWVEPGLGDAVAGLPVQQRVVVTLLYCFEWTMSEVAELLGVSKSTVQTHADRGMTQLRNRMGVGI
jgi:DNA-directed RNA polymerase specialized sigma24 family protein